MVSGSEVARAFTTAQAGLASLHPVAGYDYAFPTKMFAATACGAPVVHAGPGPGRAMVTAHRLCWAWQRRSAPPCGGAGSPSAAVEQVVLVPVLLAADELRDDLLSKSSMPDWS